MTNLNINNNRNRYTNGISDIGSIFRFPSMIGFDSLFKEITDTFDSVSNSKTSNYPPYNVINDGDRRYIIELAVAGFTEEQLNIELHERNLVISGESGSKTADSNDESSDAGDDTKKYIYRGISQRAFKRVFTIADDIEIISAKLKNGILTVIAERKVQETRAKKIAIDLE